VKAPFPYFGGLAVIASAVWDAIGDVGHYIEPFAGSLAVLLARPSWHKGNIESVNDADCLLANVWRGLQFDPDGCAKWADWPVNHVDLKARKKWLIENKDRIRAGLAADPKFFDAEAAGYWIWSASCWIGSGMTCPNQRPHISHGGKGIHAMGQRPHISQGGMGIHAMGQRPHISHGGMGAPFNTNIYETFRALQERLRYVRVVCGDWTQVSGGDWQTFKGSCGYFADPPYSDVATRVANIYDEDSLTVAHDVRAWMIARDHDPLMRMVLKGYFEEHEELLARGWRVHKWSAQGGYANLAGAGGGNSVGQDNRHREALFFSPSCLDPSQPSLFGTP